MICFCRMWRLWRNIICSEGDDVCGVRKKQDQVNNADSAIIFLIYHWSVRIVKVVWSVRVVEVVQDVQIVHMVHWSMWSKWSRWYGRKEESSAVFCLSRICNNKICDMKRSFGPFLYSQLHCLFLIIPPLLVIVTATINKKMILFIITHTFAA